MFSVLRTLGRFAVDLLKSRRRLEEENLLLRRQLTIALRRKSLRLRLRGSDRALLVCMTRLWPSLLEARQLVRARQRRVYFDFRISWSSTDVQTAA